MMKNFCDNFAALKCQIWKHKARTVNDEARHHHDMEIHQLAKDLEECWDGSSAQECLIADINEGKHEQMKPKELYSSRPEYQIFELEKFRKYIYQETRLELETNYWIVKRKMKENREKAKRKGKDDNPDNWDFNDPVLG